jgi:hypothetical protein
MDEDNNDLYADFVINIFISIFLILAIISALPLMTYLFYNIYYLSKGTWKAWNEDDYPFVKNFTLEPNKLDIPFNTFNEIYLFCSYIPYRKLKLCKGGTKEENVLYDYYLYKVNIIKNKLFDLKTYCDGESYDKIKSAAEAAIAVNKAKRINREHSEYMTGLRESGKNQRAQWKSNIEWAKRISSWLYTFLEYIIDLAFKIFDYVIRFINMFIPVLKAIFQNQVITGYMVIIITIYLIIYGIKKALEPPKEEEEEEVIEGAEEDGFLASMYKEYLDTLNYYNKLMKNVKIKDYTGSVLGSANNEGGDDDTIIDRPIVNGKMYDNLSYIVLSDLLSNEEQKEFLGTNIENDKYYNIYLPQEKFVNDYNPKIEPVIKWKVSTTNKNKNEKTWKLDCEAIDTIKKGETDTGIPVFISDANKCIINEEGLNDLFVNDATNEQDTIYKTEYIK